MSSSISSGSVVSGFVDLATFDELEKYMYGKGSAITYFVRDIVKCTWFTQVPVTLSTSTGNANFGGEASWAISRAGDYLLYAWLRLNTPAITPNISVATGSTGHLRWTRNLMHNLVKYCDISFNDLVAAQFDSFHLDFFSAFTVPASKRNGYNNMIGNIGVLTNPTPSGETIPSVTLNLPLTPIPFFRDWGVALPTAALPYNDMKLRVSFRNWDELLIVDTLRDTSPYEPTAASAPPTLAQVGGTAPSLSNVQMFANYAIVSNDERQRMGCGPRDILIEQVQYSSSYTVNPSTNSTPSFDVRYSHAVKVNFFGVRNTTTSSERSNYTAGLPVPFANPAGSGQGTVDFQPSTAVDPIADTSLIYENTVRLSQLGSDYYSLVAPFFHAPAIPLETGYHMYSYSLDFYCIDPKASTNYGKLTNVTYRIATSAGALAAATTSTTVAADIIAGRAYGKVQTFEFLNSVINNNVGRVSGGAFGFPIL